MGRGKRRKTESSNPGLSFAAQPAALTMAVSFTVGVKPHLPVMRLDYSDVLPILLARHAGFQGFRLRLRRLSDIGDIDGHLGHLSGRSSIELLTERTA